MGQKKQENVVFLACRMDLRLARFDICVERPVGWLDDQKKRDIVFEKTPLDRWMGRKKRGDYFIFGLLDGFRAGQVRYMCGNACWMVGWVKKNGRVFFFGLLDGFKTGQI